MKSADLAGLDVALNEASWLGLEVDETSRRAVVTLAILSLPPDGTAPSDPRVSVVLRPVGRVVVVYASPTGEILPVELCDLGGVVESFGGQPVYGWEFIDVPFAETSDVSSHVELGADGLTHVLRLFQEDGRAGCLVLWIWFDELEFRSATGQPLPLDEVVAGGKRWWDALYAGDPRTSGAGILPLTGKDE